MAMNRKDRATPWAMPLDRRELLSRSALGLGSLGLAGLLQDDGCLALGSEAGVAGSLNARGPIFRGERSA